MVQIRLTHSSDICKYEMVAALALSTTISRLSRKQNPSKQLFRKCVSSTYCNCNNCKQCRIIDHLFLLNFAIAITQRSC